MNDRFMFRAKRIDNNRFVYGYLCFIYIDNKEHCRIYCPEDTTSYDCYTKTLGQCTGLKDKNGRLIYEGDIVRAFGFTESYILVCRFRKSSFCLDYVDGRPHNFVHSVAPVEVIGNIHENGELLK